VVVLFCGKNLCVLNAMLGKNTKTKYKRIPPPPPPPRQSY
jgi:hypothetical protein